MLYLSASGCCAASGVCSQEVKRKSETYRRNACHETKSDEEHDEARIHFGAAGRGQPGTARVCSATAASGADGCYDESECPDADHHRNRNGQGTARNQTARRFLGTHESLRPQKVGGSRDEPGEGPVERTG